MRFASLHEGQRAPSGQRRFSMYFIAAFSVGNSLKSWKVLMVD
jgi:hypothetical protein